MSERWFELLEATAAPIPPSFVSEMILSETPTQRALRRWHMTTEEETKDGKQTQTSE